MFYSRFGACISVVEGKRSIEKDKTIRFEKAMKKYENIN